MNKQYIFEICANGYESAMAAEQGGAHRVELCAGMPEGGTTPSFGEIQFTREHLTIGLHVLIRPRGGDFLYSQDELEIMERDIRLCGKLGVDGVVFGCLTTNAAIDEASMRRLIGASGKMSVTFHRAFDKCVNPSEALEQLIGLGCHRVLTSGQQSSAELGIPLLKTLVEQAAGRIIILPGCGVDENNIARIAEKTEAVEFHFSAREQRESTMLKTNRQVTMGGGTRMEEYTRNVTSPERVAHIIAQLNPV